jgi:hypothetical protein
MAGTHTSVTAFPFGWHAIFFYISNERQDSVSAISQLCHNHASVVFASLLFIIFRRLSVDAHNLGHWVFHRYPDRRTISVLLGTKRLLESALCRLIGFAWLSAAASSLSLAFCFLVFSSAKYHPSLLSYGFGFFALFCLYGAFLSVAQCHTNAISSQLILYMYFQNSCALALYLNIVSRRYNDPRYPTSYIWLHIVFSQSVIYPKSSSLGTETLRQGHSFETTRSLLLPLLLSLSDYHLFSLARTFHPHPLSRARDFESCYSSPR